MKDMIEVLDIINKTVKELPEDSMANWSIDVDDTITFSCIDEEGRTIDEEQDELESVENHIIYHFDSIESIEDNDLNNIIKNYIEYLDEDSESDDKVLIMVYCVNWRGNSGYKIEPKSKGIISGLLETFEHVTIRPTDYPNILQCRLSSHDVPTGTIGYIIKL